MHCGVVLGTISFSFTTQRPWLVARLQCRLTLPFRKYPKGCAFWAPLMSTIGNLQWARNMQNEIENREKAGIAAIRSAFGTDEDESGATLFVEHHLEEIEGEYWQKHLGATNPEPINVLDILVLRSHWGGDDEIETFDFTLPEDVTDYVISVRFDESHRLKIYQWRAK